MKRSTDRILTTHTGSLPRPPDLVDMVAARESRRRPTTRPRSTQRVRDAVARSCRSRPRPASTSSATARSASRASSSTCATASTASKASTREPAASTSTRTSPATRSGASPAAAAPAGAHAAGRVHRARWPGRTARRCETDIANFKAALGGAGVEEAFMPSASVGIVAQRLRQPLLPDLRGLRRGHRRASCATSTARSPTPGFVLQIDAPEMCIDRDARVPRPAARGLPARAWSSGSRR